MIDASLSNCENPGALRLHEARSYRGDGDLTASAPIVRFGSGPLRTLSASVSSGDRFRAAPMLITLIAPVGKGAPGATNLTLAESRRSATLQKSTRPLAP